MAAFINVDKTILVEALNDIDFRITLDQALLVNFEDQTRWLLKNRFSSGTEMPNYLNYIHIESLKAVKPEAVSIIH